MLPIIRTDIFKNPYNNWIGKANVVLYNGKECVQMIDGIHPLKKNGTISKRKIKEH